MLQFAPLSDLPEIGGLKSADRPATYNLPQAEWNPSGQRLKFP
jgi:hypothetical protein